MISINQADFFDNFRDASIAKRLNLLFLLLKNIQFIKFAQLNIVRRVARFALYNFSQIRLGG